jgi:Uri superfamily endonuclease
LKGIYVLAITVSKDTEVGVGALGNIDFRKGLYAYVGSAQKRLENRVKRHLKGVRKRNFWHVDYLLDNSFTEVVRVFYKEADKSMECEIAENLKKKGIPIANFGCSDCTCKSHLFKINDFNFFKDFMSEM